MFNDTQSIIDFLNRLIETASTPEVSIFSSLLTFFGIMIISGIIGYIFTRFFRSRWLSFLVTSASAVWLYELVFIQEIPLLRIVISFILFITFLIIFGIIVFVIFIKKAPLTLKS